MGESIDLKSQKFGKLTVIEPSEKRDSTGSILYKCQCECGGTSYVSRRHLKNGHTKSCGCTRTEKFNKHREATKLNLKGQKFGKLTALKPIGTDTNRQVIWHCKCDCGKEIDVLGVSLKKGNTQSCGCISSSNIKELIKLNNIEKTNIAIIKSLYKNSKSNKTKSGVKGVGWNKRSNKWRAYIMFQGKQYELGHFVKVEDAIKIRKEAEEKLFGPFLEWYKENFKED